MQVVEQEVQSRPAGRLAGRVALVTGAGRGLGQAYAARLAREGARIVIVDVGSGEETVENVRQAGGEAIAIEADITSSEAVQDISAEAHRVFGKVDVLVNNAGIFPFNAFENIPLEEWRRVMAVNVKGPFLLIQSLIAGMRERGWGRVINISSNTGWTVAPNFAHYITSKLAIVGLTRALASEYGAHGVTVNCIAPSLTPTPGTRASPAAELFDKYPEMQAIPRIETPEDLADVIAFLASDDARFITAQTIAVDGGLIRL